MAKLTKMVTGTASAISRLPSFLIGLLIIAVLAGGAYGAWRVVSHCSGQSFGACLLSAINPVPASYGRGAGEPLRCADNEDMDGGLCYAKCQAGYKGVGPVCCQEACPTGFRDDGTFCAKPASYGRGAGYPWQFGDALNDSGMFNRCTAANGANNCEKSGEIVYPKCIPSRLSRCRCGLAARQDQIGEAAGSALVALRCVIGSEFEFHYGRLQLDDALGESAQPSKVVP